MNHPKNKYIVYRLIHRQINPTQDDTEFVIQKQIYKVWEGKIKNQIEPPRDKLI
jgi:hypothetical protein